MINVNIILIVLASMVFKLTKTLQNNMNSWHLNNKKKTNNNNVTFWKIFIKILIKFSNKKINNKLINSFIKKKKQNNIKILLKNLHKKY